MMAEPISRVSSGAATQGETSGPSTAALMPFIVSFNVDKADPATRKLIRSHVMRGKKPKKVRPEAVQQAAKLAGLGIRRRVESRRVELPDVLDLHTSVTLLDRVGSDLSGVELPDGIDMPMVLQISRGLLLDALFFSGSVLILSMPKSPRTRCGLSPPS